MDLFDVRYGCSIYVVDWHLYLYYSVGIDVIFVFFFLLLSLVQTCDSAERDAASIAGSFADRDRVASIGRSAEPRLGALCYSQVRVALLPFFLLLFSPCLLFCMRVSWIHKDQLFIFVSGVVGDDDVGCLYVLMHSVDCFFVCYHVDRSRTFYYFDVRWVRTRRLVAQTLRWRSEPSKNTRKSSTEAEVVIDADWVCRKSLAELGKQTRANERFVYVRRCLSSLQRLQRNDDNAFYTR